MTATQTRERPILFSAPMVRAILAGTKTQTRRVLNPQPVRCKSGDDLHIIRNGKESLTTSLPSGGSSLAIHCPYGVPGDRLWVRETWTLADMIDGESLGAEILYAADEAKLLRSIGSETDLACAEEFAKWQRKLEYFEVAGAADGMNWMPSIHMPRWASRLAPDITAVRVERLREISHDDACSEGIDDTRGGEDACIARFTKLWESINGPGSWDQNPWVWVISFKHLVGKEGR